MEHEVPALYCCVCTRVIEVIRLARGRGAVTCSKECSKKLKDARRKLVDKKRCRICGAPSTPEQRKQFKRWQRESGQLQQAGRPQAEKAEAATA